MDSPSSTPTSLDRRSFLSGGLALGAAALLRSGTTRASVPACPGAAGADEDPIFEERVPGHRFQLSCAGYSFRQNFQGKRSPSMTLEDFMDLCAREQLDGVELTSYFFPRTDTEYLASLRRRAFLNGLTITGTPVGNNFCLPPGEEREKQIHHVKAWVDHAVVLGAPCIRIFAGQAPRRRSEDEARGWAVDCLREVCRYAGTHGIVLALENHGGITATAGQLLRLIEETDSPWLGVNLDTGNFQQNPYEEIRRAAPYAVVVQHKVEVRGEGGRKEPSDLGRILDILRAAAFRGVIALEYEASEDPLKAVPRHLAELRESVRGSV